MKSKRDSLIDILKGLGIICMVAGHSGAPITQFIYLFHMAIFFIASGYCFKENCSSDIKEVKEFFKRKIISLWFPYVLWTAIYSLLHNFFIKINVYTDNPLLLQYVSGTHINIMEKWNLIDITKNIIKAFLLHGGTQLGGAFWFLAILFEISIAYCIIDFFIKKIINKKAVWAQSIIAVLLLILGYLCYLSHNRFWGVDRVFSYYILYHGGFLLKKYNISALIYKKSRLLCVIISLLILLLANQKGSIALDDNSYENPLYLLTVSYVGWQLLYEISYYLSKIDVLKKIMIGVGQNTLSVVILHFLSFKIVSFIGVLLKAEPWCLVAAFPILYRGNGWWILYTMAGVTIPVCLSLMWKKTKLYIWKRRGIIECFRSCEGKT